MPPGLTTDAGELFRPKHGSMTKLNHSSNRVEAPYELPATIRLSPTYDRSVDGKVVAGYRAHEFGPVHLAASILETPETRKCNQ